MKSEILSKNPLPYQFFQVDEHDFRFTTETGNVYYIYFLEYWQQDVVQSFVHDPIMIYEFNFEVEKLVKVSHDNRIAFTIFSILELYLAKKNSVVYYVTQRMDGRSKQLFRLYQLWYNMSLRATLKLSGKIMKVDKVVESYGFIDAYISCMAHEDFFKHIEQLGSLTEKVLLEIFQNSTVRNF